jgi:diguanylate cyclase
VLEQLSDLKEPAYPRTYEVLYHHVTGERPLLKKAVDEVVQRSGKIGTVDIDRIADEYLSDRNLTEVSNSVASHLSVELRQLLNAVELAILEAGDRSQRFSVPANPAQLGGRDQLRALVEGLVLNANEMQRSNRELEDRLNASNKIVRKLREEVSAIRAESLIDPLTSLSNRKHFDQSVSGYLKKAFQTGSPACLLMVDIDHFKKINDDFGHPIGDQIIRMVAHTMLRMHQSGNLLARYGGEEFVLVLAQSHLDAALAVANRIRQEVNEREFKLRNNGQAIGRISVSIGVSTFRRDDTPLSLIERADECLYIAKRSGRNRVVCERDTAHAA